MKNAEPFDPFSERLLKGDDGLWSRWLGLRDRHRYVSDSLFAGMAAAEFTDHELTVLGGTGLVSEYDRQVMSRIGRPVGGVVTPETEVEFG